MLSKAELIKNLPTATGAALLVFSLVSGGIENFQGQQSHSNLIRAQRRAQQNELIQLELANDAAKQEAAIAEARYEMGCILVLTEDQSSFTSLTEGAPVIDITRNVPLPNKSLVCDSLGNSGVIENGVVSKMAFTGNRDVIQQAIATFAGQVATYQPTPSHRQEPEP